MSARKKQPVDTAAPVTSGRKKKATQIDLFSVLAEAEDGEGIWSGQATARLGVTTLDDPFRRRPWGGAEAVFG